MTTNYSYAGDKISLGTIIQDDYVVTSVGGAEVYSLTDKASGKVSLAAFSNRIAANRFFAANKDYYAQKIL